MELLTHYCVDIDSKTPEVLEFSKDDIIADMEYYNVKSPLELSDHNRKIFKTDKEAENFLKLYNDTRESLNFYRNNSKKGIPKILLKRRYMITTLMGVKTYTTRHYKKPWTSGQVFQFYDQTFFIDCVLKRIEETTIHNKPFYIYHFELLEK